MGSSEGFASTDALATCGSYCVTAVELVELKLLAGGVFRMRLEGLWSVVVVTLSEVEERLSAVRCVGDNDRLLGFTLRGPPVEPATYHGGQAHLSRFQNYNSDLALFRHLLFDDIVEDVLSFV